MTAITEFRVENKPVSAIIRKPNNKYPFKDMEVGQSFFIPDRERMLQVKVACYSFGKRHQMVFAIVADGKGYRCGRIK